MNRQKFFAEIMAMLIGKQIDSDEKISLSRHELETNCAKLSAEINDTKFKIDIAESYEHCPFLCNNFDKPFDFVFVGLNPGGALDSREKFYWERTTWRDLQKRHADTENFFFEHIAAHISALD